MIVITLCTLPWIMNIYYVQIVLNEDYPWYAIYYLRRIFMMCDLPESWLFIHDMWFALYREYSWGMICSESWIFMCELLWIMNIHEMCIDLKDKYSWYESCLDLWIFMMCYLPRFVNIHDMLLILICEYSWIAEILEGESIVVGAVPHDYDLSELPGCHAKSVGYHSDDGG